VETNKNKDSDSIQGYTLYTPLNNSAAAAVDVDYTVVVAAASDVIQQPVLYLYRTQQPLVVHN